MPSLFVDTSYLIARFNRHDAFHQRATEMTNELTSEPASRLTTTVMILEEFLTDMSRRHPQLKREVVS